MQHRRGLAVVCLALLAGCTSSDNVTIGTAGTTSREPSSTVSTTDPPSTQTTTPPVIEWYECGDRQDCGSLEVPLDYSDPSLGTMTLNLRRSRADESKRIGTLLANRGGPGFDSTVVAESARGYFSDDLVEHFDVVGWDPRGTGASQPAVDCVDDYDQYFAEDLPPDNAQEQQALEDAAAAFRAACQEHSGSILAHVSTINSARDMDLIRQALGEDQVSYFGFSYGSELGATWATLFPDTVRAAVFDGAIESTGIQLSLEQAKGFEIALNAFLEDCRGRCEFAQGGDPGAAFDQILADINANAYPTRDSRPPLNRAITYIAVIEAMYDPFDWPDLADALEAARNGDGGPMLDLYDDYNQRQPDGTYSNALEAFWAITCVDGDWPTTVAGIDEYNDDMIAAAPHMGASFAYGYVCVDWPAPASPAPSMTADGAPPILVIGTTNDPATPYESSRKMASDLDKGVLVTVHGDGHTGYWQSDCARDVTDRYLIDLEVPDGDVDCG